MKSIWVVENGEYSDYHVVGVFSTKENAERVNALTGGRGRVSEWALDPAIAELNKGYHFYSVAMSKDGTVRNVEREDEVATYHIQDARVMQPWVDMHDHSKGTYIIDHAWARDDAHAVKIVNERRAQMIANGEWRDS